MSVVVVSWNTSSMIGAALDGVPAACAPLSVETVVVDNGSEDGSRALLEARDDIDVVALDDNTGFTHAANEGVRRTHGRYVLFLNPDVVLPPASVSRLAEALEATPGGWAATPWFRNPDGTPQYFWRRLLGPVGSVLCFTRWGRRLDKAAGNRWTRHRAYRELPDPPPRMAIDTAGAACLLVRRDLFDRAGGFDERYFNFFQDTHLVRQLRAERRVLLGAGDIEVEHLMGATFRELPPWFVDAQLLRGLRQYMAGEPWWRRLVVEVAVRVDLLLPMPHRKERKEFVLRPLDRPR